MPGMPVSPSHWRALCVCDALLRRPVVDNCVCACHYVCCCQELEKIPGALVEPNDAAQMFLARATFVLSHPWHCASYPDPLHLTLPALLDFLKADAKRLVREERGDDLESHVLLPQLPVEWDCGLFFE